MGNSICKLKEIIPFKRTESHNNFIDSLDEVLIQTPKENNLKNTLFYKIYNKNNDE